MPMILLVDDDKDILKMGELILTHGGHEVKLADSAPHALELINKFRFDLIISDANMPEHSGYDLIKSVKSHKDFKHIPIALLTARREKKDIELAIKLGVKDYIVKPLDPGLLLQKVENIFETHPPVSKVSLNVAEVKVELPAKIQLDTKVLSVSEAGLLIESSQPLFENQIIQLDSDIFSQMKIKAPILKVHTCDPAATSSSKWHIRVTFYGANDGTLQKIRGWINTETLKKRGGRFAA